MAAPEILHGADDLAEPIESRHHRAEHGHELPALLGDVPAEHGAEVGVELEQPLVEELGRSLLDRQHVPPGGLHQSNLSRIHTILLSWPPGQTAPSPTARRPAEYPGTLSSTRGRSKRLNNVHTPP